MRRAPLALVLVASILLAPFAAHADAYDEAMARGAVARERAIEAHDPALWEDALSAFEEADRLNPTKEAKFELANAAVHLHADDLAYDAFDQALAAGLGGKAAEIARSFVSAHAGSIAHLAVVGPTGAQLRVESRVRATLPMARPIAIFTGKVHVVVQTEDGRTAARDVDASVGEVVHLDLTSAFAPPATSSSGVVATSLPPVPRDEGASDRKVGWTFAEIGGAVVVVGLGGYLLSTARISSERGNLSSDCDHPSGEDTCKDTAASKVKSAQGDVDAIATWKAVRVGAFVTVGLGAVGAIFGVTKILSAPVAPSIGFAPGGGTFAVQGVF